MPKIPSITEQELQNLSPFGLDENFLLRLTACAEGTAASLTDDELDFENHLHTIRPRTVPASLHTSLLGILGDAPFAVDEKIVLFNKATAGTGSGKTRGFFRFNIAAAAAVALLGSIAAFIVPDGSGGTQTANAGDAKVPVNAPPLPESINVAPASFNRYLSETRDEGVIWRGKNQPHRVFSHTIVDPFSMEKSRVEYLIIPEKVD
jgi:hypothetical protein